MSKLADFYKVSGRNPVMHVQDQKPTGTGGGTSIASWNVRNLNTVLKNEIVGAVLSSNEVTLPEGEYFFDVSSVVSGTNQKCRLSVGDDIDPQLISGESSIVVAGSALISTVRGYVTLGSVTTIKVNAYLSVAVTNGLGIPSNQNPHEMYTDLLITKIDEFV